VLWTTYFQLSIEIGWKNFFSVDLKSKISTGSLSVDEKWWVTHTWHSSGSQESSSCLSNSLRRVVNIEDKQRNFKNKRLFSITILAVLAISLRDLMFYCTQKRTQHQSELTVDVCYQHLSLWYTGTLLLSRDWICLFSSRSTITTSESPSLISQYLS